MSKELKVSPASSWGVPTEVVKLPSGQVAEFKRLNVLVMIQRGGKDVPNFLKSYVARSLQGEATGDPMKEMSDPADAIAMILYLAKNVFVYPKLVDGEPQNDDEVSIEAVSVEDLSFAAGYGLGDESVVRELERFRDAETSDVEPVPASVELVEISE